MTYKVFTDGASKGNPGEASIGVVCISRESLELNEFKVNESAAEFLISQRIGQATNNEAEYTSLIKAMEELQRRNINRAEIFMDSELVIRQINGQYKVKSAKLLPYWQKVKSLAEGKKYTFHHIKRDKNQIADYLANRAFQNG